MDRRLGYNLLTVSALPVCMLALSLIVPSHALAQDQTGMQIIILQENGSTTGMHLALGGGENLQFASSLDAGQVEWFTDENGIRTGKIIDPALVNGVAQGVCVGPACDLTIETPFTSVVGSASLQR